MAKKRPSADLRIGRYARAASEIPFQRKGIQPEPVSCTCWLRQQKYGHNINRIFEPATQGTGTDRISQHPSVAPPQVPHASVRRPPIQPVTSTRPHFQPV